jgi:dihydroorotase
MTAPHRSPGTDPLTLIVAGGIVVDPGSGIHERLDVGLRGDRVAAVGRDLPRGPATQVLDVGGRLVTPGLIDLHAHLFHGMSQLGVDPDTTCLPVGVTTAVDAGTAGEITFSAFAQRWLRPATTRCYAFVNVSSIGLPLDDGLELGDSVTRYVDVGRIVEVIEANRDVCLGVKIRAATYQMRHGVAPLTAALEATARTGTRLMVHITEPGIALDAVFDRLRPGDIVTHLFHGRRERIVGSDGKVLDSLRRAVARGVRTDIGHGGGSFAFATARAAMADGFRPDTISTDLHPFSMRGAMRDLPTTMSKFLALGMSVDEVIAATTVNAARTIARPELTGTLAIGAPADVAVLDEVVELVELEDTVGERITADRELRPRATIRAGKVVFGGGGAA